MAKHRAERYRKPKEWRWRRVRNRWYGYAKPYLRQAKKALQAQIKANLQNFIRKLR